MSGDMYDTWKDTVKRVARFVSYDFPDVRAEDIEQDLFLLILERRWDNPNNSQVLIVLRRFANWKAMQYRAQGLSLTPQYSYRTSEVKQILEKVFDHEDWPRRAVPTKPGRDGNDIPQWDLATDDALEREGVAQNGQHNRMPRVDSEDGSALLVGRVAQPTVDWDDRITSYIDVKAAYNRLPHQYKEAILKKYGLEIDPPTGAETKRLQRAVERLTDILNWYRGLGE